MHILHLVKTSETALWVYNMMKGIKESHPEISFSVMLPFGGKYQHKYEDVCRDIYDFDFKIDRKLFNRGSNFRNIVLQDNPDIIHSWYTQTTLYARLFLRNSSIPRLFEVIGPLHLEFFMYRWFDILSAQKNDYWKATSKRTLYLYQKFGVKNEKLFFSYLPNNVDELLSKMKESSPLNLREENNIPDNFKIIGTASIMYPPKLFKKNGVKNHEMLLEVFGKLLAIREDVVLVIGGTTLGNDKSYEHKIKALASKIRPDKIIFTGWVENLGRLITEFDVFVFLSYSENLGGVYESLLYQVPTVASDRGGIPELVIDGHTGFTCNLKSIDEIVNKINLLLDDADLKEKFKTNGLKQVRQTFNKQESLNIAYETYVKLFQQDHK